MLIYSCFIVVAIIGVIFQIGTLIVNKRNRLDIINSEIDQNIFLNTKYTTIRVSRERTTLSPGKGKLQPKQIISINAPEPKSSSMVEVNDYLKVECKKRKIPYEILVVPFSINNRDKILMIVKKHKCGNKQI
ncbi:MAG TPA: hypothetical protein PLU93_09445 [Treponemataceae bacterium]|nr:hypothetical protein [Treponemataceae bacterium]